MVFFERNRGSFLQVQALSAEFNIAGILGYNPVPMLSIEALIIFKTVSRSLKVSLLRAIGEVNAGQARHKRKYVEN